jgi:transcriptional regulator with XRE-family HTH domain
MPHTHSVAVRPVEKFAAHLRELRETHGLSQTRLAELAGLNRNYVGDVERGRRNPCLDNIIKLAEALDVSPSELFRPFDKRR